MGRVIEGGGDRGRWKRGGRGEGRGRREKGEKGVRGGGDRGFRKQIFYQDAEQGGGNYRMF